MSLPPTGKEFDELESPDENDWHKLVIKYSVQQGKAEAIDKTLKLLEKIMQERKDILKLITKKIYSTEFKNYAINTEMTEGDLKFALDMRKLFANEIKELLGEITFSEKGYKLWLGIKSKINNKGDE